MKRFFLLFLLFTLGLKPTHSQSFYPKQKQVERSSHLSISATSFRSIRGWKHGIDIGYNTRKDWFVGAFWYQSIWDTERGTESFQGLEIGFPLVKMGRWAFGSNQRIGIYNEKFLSFLSTIKLDYSASDLITTSLGCGVSDRFPVFDFKLIFHLTKKLP